MPEQNSNSNPLPSSTPFIQRMEQQRLARECTCLLDLRKLSADLCRRYNYRGRSMWLDATSRKQFLEDLKANAGVFTVASYEAILNPYLETETEKPHTDYGRRIQPTPSTRRPEALSEYHYRAQSSTFELGYFEKRVEDRVKHKVPVLVLTGNGQVIPAETRDISIGGLLVKTKLPIQASSGEVIRIKIPSSNVGGRSLPEATYRIVHVKSLLAETKLALVCEGAIPKETLDYFSQIVSSHLGGSPSHANIDTDDALLTSYALLAERYYMRSSTIVPLFLFKVATRGTPLKIVFRNESNLPTLKAFEVSPGNYDLSPLARHSFIKLLVKLARRESQADALLAVYRPEPEIPSLILNNTECEQSHDWYQFLSHHIDKPGFFVFKIISRQIHIPNSHRIMNDLDSLALKSAELAEKLIEETDRLLVAGSLIDVTEEIRSWNLARFLPRDSGETFKCPHQTEDNEQLQAPEIWPVSFIEDKRAENRFIGQMRVSIDLDGVKHGGRTRDISTHGLSIFSDDPAIPVKTGKQLLISFPGIKKGSHGLGRLWGTYRDIPFEVVAVERGAPTLLRLKQIPGGQSNRFARAFTNFIEERRSKLPIELSHLRRSAASRLYASYFVESSGTLPVFVFKNENERRYALKIGISRSPSYLAGFFEVSEGEFDFSPLADRSKLDKMIEEMDRIGSVETRMFLYKELIPGGNRFRILPFEDNQPNRSKLQSNFINQPFGADFRYVKLVLSVPRHPNPSEIEQAMERLGSAPRSRAEQLRSEFSKLTAIGDIVDITGQLSALQPFSLY